MNVSVEKTVNTAGKEFQVDQDTLTKILSFSSQICSWHRRVSHWDSKYKICNEILHIVVECHFTAFLSVAFF